MASFDDPAFYGERWADIYDEHFGMPDPAAAVDFLVGLADGGRVLELAIGTGRVALPLAARGITVEGVDASAAMVERMRAKPGGESIGVTIGNMAQVPASGPFNLVYLVFNTLFALLSQEQQAECFRNAARVLSPDGAFVIECFIPDLAGFDQGQRMRALDVAEESVIFALARHDAVRQRITTQIVTLDEHGIRMQPSAIRYSWPGELDLMAGQAGLRLAARYADWDRRAFDSTSSAHVSIYKRAGRAA